MTRFVGLMCAAIGMAVVALPALAGPVASAPEPASLSLLAVGIGGVAWAKFRKRK
jgi:hypothetical protein